MRFPGQYWDEEKDSAYNYQRDCYDPATGRYCQPDPIGLEGGLNPYLYGEANPLTFVDPEGLETMVLPRPWLGPVEMTKPVPSGTIDPTAPFPDTGQPPQKDPFSQKCVALAQKISNLKKEVFEKRIPDLQANPGNLPERIAPGENLSETVRGHRKLLNRQWRRLRELEDRYDKECIPRC